MDKHKRSLIYSKFNGRCAYSGKSLDESWQVDHMRSKQSYDQILKEAGHYVNPDGEKMTPIEYHSEFNRVNKNSEGKRTEEYLSISRYKWKPPIYVPHESCEHINNLLPSLKIINHYKRSLDLEGFREYMITFKVRWLSINPNTKSKALKKRLEYLNQVADAFNITKDTDFDGEFYFEKYNKGFRINE